MWDGANRQQDAVHENESTRCPWAADELAQEYHDAEWGVPVHDDVTLFEFLILEAAQAGLSWSTILKKRDNYRKAYRGFDPKKVARFGERDRQRLLRDAGIVRNRLKIDSSIDNARAFLKVQEEFGSFDAYVWSFVNNEPIDGRRRAMADLPATSAKAEALSKDLKRRAFRFVGPTICYAFMQAVGLVNDHLVTCFRYGQIARLR